MSEDLQALLSVAGDEGPPVEFAQSLRTAMVDEAERVDQGLSATTDEFDEIELEPTVTELAGDNLTIDLRVVADSEEHEGRNYSLWVAAAAAVIAIVAGVMLNLPEADDGGLETIAPPETTETPTTTAAGPSVSDEPDGVYDPTATVLVNRGFEFFPDGNARVNADNQILPGTYRSEVVGTPVSINLLSSFEVNQNEDGSLRLDAGATGFLDKAVLIDRISELSDPSRPEVPFEELGESWPANDIEGWLDALAPSILVENVQQTTLGGLPATRFELTPDGDACRVGVTCAYFAANHGQNETNLIGGGSYEIWVADQGDEDPIAVVVTNLRSDGEWRELSREMVATIGFGTVGANPVSTISAGIVELEFLDGIRADFPEEEIAIADAGRFGRVRLGDWLAETAFLARPSNLDGEALETADELAAALEDFSALVGEADPTMIDGFEARVFDIADAGQDTPSRALFVDGETERAWLLPTQGRLWVVEHPDRGLLVITAEVSTSVGAVAWPRILDRTEQIVRTLEFIE